MAHDLGLLAIRLALGLMLVAHGANKVFGPGGLRGTTAWFASLGLRPAWTPARLAAGTEVVAGLLLGLGLLTGQVCAAYVGLMLVAALTGHRVMATSSSTADTSTCCSSAWWSLGAAVLGVGAVSGLLATFRRPSRTGRPAEDAWQRLSQ
jgi:putative oxidoreductase